MSGKVKVIYDRSTNTGFNRFDSAMLEPAEAAKVVKSGDAHYEKLPKSKSKEKPK